MNGTFPATRHETLALIYLQNQDLTGKTPKQINEIYWKAFNEIERDTRERLGYLKSL